MAFFRSSVSWDILFSAYSIKSLGLKEELTFKITLLLKNAMVFTTEIWPKTTASSIRLVIHRSRPLFNTFPRLLMDVHMPVETISQIAPGDHLSRPKRRSGRSFRLTATFANSKNSAADIDASPTYHTCGNQFRHTKSRIPACKW